MTRRQITILLILFLMVVGVIVYAIFFRGTTTPAEQAAPSEQQTTGEPQGVTGTTGTTPSGATPEATTTTTTEFPPAATAGDTYVLKKLSDGPVVGYWAAKNSNDVYYLTNDGYVMSAKEGPDVDLLKQEVKGVIKLEGSPSGNKALVAFGNAASPQWAVFDTQDKAWRPLPSTIIDATWGISDDGIVATTKSMGNNIALTYITISKTPFDIKTIVKDFRFNSVTLAIKSIDELYIMERPSALALSHVWLFNLKSNALTQVLNPANGLTLVPGSNKDIFFRFSSPNNFAILNRSLGMTQPFPYVTLPQKCDGVSTAVYCFVPKNTSIFSASNSMPDDYLMKKTYTSDDFYRLDLTTGGDRLIVTGDSANAPALDAQNVRTRGTSTYFVNRYDNYVYAIQKAQ